MPDYRPFESVPNEILILILDAVVPKGHDALRLILKCVCRRWNSLIKIQDYKPNHPRAFFECYDCEEIKIWGSIGCQNPIHIPRKFLEINLYLDIAKFGYLELFKWVRKIYPNVNDSWHSAILDGSTHIDWLSLMLEGSAQNRQIGFCEFAKNELGVKDFDCMLWGAAKGGHVDICRLAKSWGANDFQVMIWKAAKYGHANICKLGKQWEMEKLETERWREHRFIVTDDGEHQPILSKDLSVSTFNHMLDRAVEGKQIEVCKLARKWGANRFRQMIWSSILNNNVEMCKLGVSWQQERPPISVTKRLIQTMNPEEILTDAARFGRVEICKIAKKAGARKFNAMLSAGVHHNHPEICALAKEWIRQKNDI